MCSHIYTHMHECFLYIFKHIFYVFSCYMLKHVYECDLIITMSLCTHACYSKYRNVNMCMTKIILTCICLYSGSADGWFHISMYICIYIQPHVSLCRGHFSLSTFLQIHLRVHTVMSVFHEPGDKSVICVGVYVFESLKLWTTERTPGVSILANICL